MNAVDIILVFIVFLSVLLGVWRGVTREVLGVSSWAAAGISAYFLYPFLVPVVEFVVSHHLLKKLMAILLVFFITLVVFSAITYALSDSVKSSIVGRVDRGLGGIYGLARGIFIVSLLAFLSQKTIFKGENKAPLSIRTSVLWGWAASMTDRAIHTIPEETLHVWRGYVDEVLGGVEESDLPKLQYNFPDEDGNQLDD